MSRPHTDEEVRDKILHEIKSLERYWDSLPDKTSAEKLSGLSFSILTMIDGCGMDLPVMDITLRPHPDDKAFHESEGENYFENGMVVNEHILLHEFYHKPEEM